MSTAKGGLLVVDDDRDILTAVALLARPDFTDITVVSKPDALPQLLMQKTPDVVLLDMNFGPGQSDGAAGFTWLEKILAIDAEAVVIMITAHGNVSTAVEAMKRGAVDFVTKPWQNEKLLATLNAGRLLRRTRQQAARLAEQNRALADHMATPDGPMLGTSPAMGHVTSIIGRVAPTDATVLILGENGTGKELAARAVHHQSHRSAGPFVSVDLGAVSETLFESEMFGHKKGAFTDARAERVGRCVAADGGTLFLDEIGNLPLHLQPKLLTALEQRHVTPVGANTPVPFDARIIAATNLPIEALRDEGRFRQDLLFRLNTVELHLPPLRARAGDIRDLVTHYIRIFSEKYAKPIKPLSPPAWRALETYDWPGNIRALKHAVERAVILAVGEIYGPEDFSFPTQLRAEGGLTPKSAPRDPPDFNLAQLERRTLQAALQTHSYNISHTAKALGITRASLYRRMEKHGL